MFAIAMLILLAVFMLLVYSVLTMAKRSSEAEEGFYGTCPDPSRKPRRYFPPEIKRYVVHLLAEGADPKELCATHGITRKQLNQWRKQYVEEVANEQTPTPAEA